VGSPLIAHGTSTAVAARAENSNRGARDDTRQMLRMC